jgi:hypothetical protein
MKIRISGLSVALIFLLLLFLASEIISPKLRLQAQVMDTPVSRLSGYKVIDARGDMVDPKGCGPFLRWNLDSFPDGKIPYYINKKGSKDLSLTEIKRAAEESFAAWKNLSGVALDFRFAGFTDAAGFKRDGKNVIFFDEAGAVFSASDTTEALGKTRPVDFDKNTGELKEVDIALNGKFIPPVWKSKQLATCAGYAFKTPIKWSLTEQRCVERVGAFPVEYRAHLKSTLTHEIGHFLGLGHSSSVGATMSTAEISNFAENTDQSTLEEDDRKGAEFLYPSDVRDVSESGAAYNIALGKSVRIATNGTDDACLFCENASFITDGSLAYATGSRGQVQAGNIGWQNNDYNELMEITVAIDLGERFRIEKIRSNTGNVMRAETWNADSMITPFGKTVTNAGSKRVGAWTEQKGSLTASKLTITFQKTRKKWAEDWIFIGEIEIIGTPAEDSDLARTKASKLNQANPNFWAGNIDPRRCWQSTGIVLQRGDRVFITSSGTVTWDPTIKPISGTVGPNGSGYSASKIKARPVAFPLLSASPGSLVMRIGNSIYFAGERVTVQTSEYGTVEFMVNDEADWLFDNSGRFTVRVQKR